MIEYTTMIVKGVSYKIPKFKCKVDDCEMHTPKDVYLMEGVQGDKLIPLWFGSCSDCGTDYEVKATAAINALSSGAPYRGQDKEFSIEIPNSTRDSSSNLEKRICDNS